MKLEIKIFSKPDDIANHIAEEILKMIFENKRENRESFIALSGGNTPKVLFDKLSADSYKNKVEWNNLHLFWGDERCVPPENDQSNFGMTKKHLINKINIPEENTHRIMGENNPEDEVKRITKEIKSIVPFSSNLPQFDMILLGLGTDGHTASLFPGKKLKNISDKITGIAKHPESGQKRISLTYDVINNSKKNIFMVTGEEKADILFRVMSEKTSKRDYPAAKIKAVEVLKWYLDKDAASKIKKP